MNEKVNEMEYVYAAMLLHSAGKDIDDKAVGSVLKAAGVEADGARAVSYTHLTLPTTPYV